MTKGQNELVDDGCQKLCTRNRNTEYLVSHVMANLNFCTIKCSLVVGRLALDIMNYILGRA